MTPLGGASGAILENYGNMLASPGLNLCGKTSFTKVFQSSMIVLFAKIFLRFNIGFVSMGNNYYSYICLDCFLQILMNTFVHSIANRCCI